MKRLFFIVLALHSALCTMNSQTTKGDINGDGNLSLNDVAALKDIFLGKQTSSLPASSLDINSDGTLSVCDMTKLIDMVLNKKEGGLDVGIGGWEDDDEDYGGTVSAPRHNATSSGATISVNDLSARPGAVVDVPIAMSNNVTINGFQMTVELPSGFEFVPFESGNYAQLTRKVGSHIIDHSAISGNRMTIVSYSTANSTYPEFAGELLRIRVKATSNTGKYQLNVNNIELSDNKFNAIRPGTSSTCNVTVSSGNLYGDVNGDGKVNITDLNIIIDVMSGVTVSGGADINGDGKVNITDLNLVIDIMSGI